MKSTAWILALSLACILPGYAEEQHLDDHDLRGAVRVVEETENVWESSADRLREARRTIRYFTRDGLLEEETAISSTGRRRSTRYAYDRDGRVVEEARTDSSGVFVDVTEHEYLEGGRVRTTVYRDVERIDKASVTLRNAAGYRIMQREYDRDGEVQLELDERHVGDTVEYVENRYFNTYVRTIRAVFRSSDRRLLTQNRETNPSRNFLPDWQWRYRYAGSQLREARFEFESRPTVRYVYGHDDDGRVNVIERYELEEAESRLTDRRTFLWNGDRRRAEVVEYFSHREGALTILGRLTYTFDEQERVLALEYRDENAGIHFRNRYAYLSDKESSHVLTNAAGYVMAETAREFDNTGRLLEETDLGADGDSEIRIYDADGLLRERTSCDRYGQVLSADEYEYDDLGNRTFHAAYGPGRQLRSRVRSEYEYDARRNWTSRTDYHTDNVQQQYDLLRRVVTRELQYY